MNDAQHKRTLQINILRNNFFNLPLAKLVQSNCRHNFFHDFPPLQVTITVECQLNHPLELLTKETLLS